MTSSGRSVTRFSGHQKVLLAVAVTAIVIGLLIIFGVLLRGWIQGLHVWTTAPADFEVSAQFGTIIGGIAGTFFALAGTLLIVLTFREQSHESKNRAFEATFFEMIRLHRSNVDEWAYSRHKKKNGGPHYTRRQVAMAIFREFEECHREVLRFTKVNNPDSEITSHYSALLQRLIDSRKNISELELASVDIAYSIVYYGLGIEGQTIIKARFHARFSDNFLHRLIFFLQLKPKQKYEKRWRQWVELASQQNSRLLGTVDNAYRRRSDNDYLDSRNDIIGSGSRTKPFEKYYGGHQSRLGHYFRHLFQSFRYLESQEQLSNQEKYTYGKLLRGQLSTYEQAILFINSITTLGMRWELLSEIGPESEGRSALITTYQLVKNVPKLQIPTLNMALYYPDIKFEFDEYST
mgnify:CR=1 FL=1|tara:strand:+ start:13200 stop:14417 length:1218 start_codon:yes stop_codon:yes gene_type:complete